MSTTPIVPAVNDGGVAGARVGALSPERQALLARRLAERRGAIAEAPIARRANDGPAPLSRAQELLWLHEQRTPGTAAYHVSLARRVRGRLDVPALERALAAVVARHEALRTAFVEVDGEPRQVVRAPAPVRVAVHDLRATPASARETEAGARLTAAAAAPFALGESAGPRPAVARLTDDESLLLLVAHHLVCDGASLGIVLGELAAAYEALLSGRDPVLGPAPLQQADLATWERARDAAPDGVADGGRPATFWRDHLDGAPTTVDLPTDAPRPGDPAAPAGRAVHTLAAALVADARALARAHDATPFMVLLAAFQTLLARCSGQDDVVVGVPVAGRARPETQRVVGHLAETLPLRARIGDDPTFAALLARVRADCLRAFDEQGAGAAPAVATNVGFVLQGDGSAPVTRLGPATLEPYAVQAGAAKFELTLSLAETPDGLRAALEYRRDLFAAVTAERMLRRFEMLLGGAVAAPGTPVSRLPLLDAAERTSLAEWASAPTEYLRGATVHARFDAQAARTPDAVAVTSDAGAHTYAALRDRADRLAGALHALGVRHGDRVGLCLPRSVGLAVAMLGILKAGAAYVPLDPAYPPARLDLMARDARLAVVVTDRASGAKLPPLDARPLLLDEMDLDELGDVPPAPGDAAPAGDGQDAAYVVYTSGSTGVPKGVVVPHRAILRLVSGPNYAALGEEDVVAQLSSPSFDAATFEVWGALLAGARLVPLDADVALAPAEFAAALVRHGVTTAFLTTALFNQVARLAPAAFAGLRHLLFGGEAVDPSAVRAVLTSGAPQRLLHVYGPTEVTTFSLWHLVEHVPAGATTVPIGRPVSGTSAYVLDRHRRLAPVGVRGELFLGGDGVALGYLGRPELTSERFVTVEEVAGPERLYRTGDVVRRAPDGAIEFVGRTDHQVKVRGFRIEPGEVEHVLNGHPAVHASVALVRELAPGDRQLVAYAAAPGTTSPAELRAYLRGRLPDYMVPAAVVVLDALPLTANGKVDRGALPAPMPNADGPAPVAPRDDVERVVAEVWGEVLGRVPPGVETSFFDLGGHSLLATRVVARLLKIFRTPLPLRRFFDAPTVAGVARTLVALEPARGRTAAVAAALLRVREMSPDERERLQRERPRTASIG
ncbi:hypothetical protein tb265_44350 [Gemmatimonadetes bacterium T265]|nr:hypothetical protein tb265_44350 [Gemmatimonadetes bacterium T265]